MSPLLQRVLAELAQLSADEQLEVIAQATALLKQRSTIQPPEPNAAANPTDPLLGLFSGSSDLATRSEEILEQEISARSGWSWK